MSEGSNPVAEKNHLSVCFLQSKGSPDEVKRNPGLTKKDSSPVRVGKIESSRFQEFVGSHGVRRNNLAVGVNAGVSLLAKGMHLMPKHR